MVFARAPGFYLGARALIMKGIVNMLKPQIKQLVEQGFNLDIISFEFDVPIQDLVNYKNNLNKDKHQRAKSGISNKTSNKNISEMQKLRNRYWEVFGRINIVQEYDYKKELKEDPETVEKMMREVRMKIEQIANLPKDERETIYFEIMSNLKELENYQLTDLQLHELKNLVFELIEKKSNIDGLIVYRPIGRYIKRNTLENRTLDLIKYYVRLIEEQLLDRTDDIDELKKILRTLTYDLQRKAPLYIGRLKDKINNKINSINKQKRTNQKDDELSEDIIHAVKDLLSGENDLENFKKTIEEEVKKKASSNQFEGESLNEKNQRRIIIRQIMNLMVNNPKEFPINNSELLLMQLKILLDGNNSEAVSIVVKALISRKEFQKANYIIDNYLEASDDQFKLKKIKSLRNQVKKAELSDFILRGIYKDDMDDDEEQRYFEQLEKGINMGNIRLGSIILGKNVDGSRSITLSDIWDKKREIQYQI